MHRTSQTVRIVVVPYDSGRLHYRMGAGPDALLGPVVDALEAAGCNTVVTHIDIPEPVTLDARAVVEHCFRTANATSSAVRHARAEGAFPVVLGGNCFNTVGAAAGVGTHDLNVVWLDAHGDLNTPETSTTGFLDGMAAAVLLGWCYQAEAQSIGSFAPLPESQFILAGARDLDPAEAGVVSAGRVSFLPADLRGNASAGLGAGALTGASRTYLHLDLDVLDPDAVGPANAFAAAGGLIEADIAGIIDEIARHTSVAGMTVSAYDPTVDISGAVARTAVALVLRTCLRTFGLDAS